MTRPFRPAGLLWLALAACGTPDADTPEATRETLPTTPAPTTGSTDTDTTTDTSLPPLSSATFTEDTAVLLNPERGFYQYIDLVTVTDLTAIRGEGSTLVFSYIRLDDHRQSDLPATLLADIERGLDAARTAGVKVIPRFSYNFGPWPNSEPDAPKEWVLRHIEQVTPILQDHADVIAVVQAGFIGAWGEWHSSTEGLLDDPATKYEIIEALLDGIPPERKVQMRYPFYKDAEYGGPLDATTAHDGSVSSRIGHHNDCFLASDTDMGTYPPGERATWEAWLEQENLYVPMGGETCAVYPDLTECTPALDTFERLHFTYINHDYHPDVVQGWKDNGCFEDIDRHLGYRLVAQDIEWREQVLPGDRIPVSLTLTNTGWAPPINPRPVQLVLASETTWAVHELDVDLRLWLPGETQTLVADVPVPADAAAGTYELGLVLPDADPTLATDARFSIRLANVDTWRDGWNGLVPVEVLAAR